MTPQKVSSSLREWTRRVWGALTGRRTDHDLQRELAGHLELAEDELRRQGHAPTDAARLARAAAGGRIQALEALREQRGLPWLDSSLLDARLGLTTLMPRSSTDDIAVVGRPVETPVEVTPDATMLLLLMVACTINGCGGATGADAGAAIARRRAGIAATSEVASAAP